MLDLATHLLLLQICIFSISQRRVIRRLLKSLYGQDELSDNVLQALGKETIKMEREFNRQAGFTKQNNRLPKWMTEQAIPETGHASDVSDEVLDHILDGIEQG